jgi:hypothetical protein
MSSRKRRVTFHLVHGEEGYLFVSSLPWNDKKIFTHLHDDGYENV